MGVRIIDPKRLEITIRQRITKVEASVKQSEEQYNHKLADRFRGELVGLQWVLGLLDGSIP